MSSTYGGVTAGRRDHCRHYVIAPAIGCEHCIEDAKILEEKIEAVVKATDKLIKQHVVRMEDTPYIGLDDARDAMLTALRELVREVRRG